MDEYVSETDSDYTSYWRDWVSFRSGGGRPTLPLSPAVSFHSNIEWTAHTDRYLVIVHFVPRKRVLLRDRRGLPD